MRFTFELGEGCTLLLRDNVETFDVSSRRWPYATVVEGGLGVAPGAGVCRRGVPDGENEDTCNNMTNS